MTVPKADILVADDTPANLQLLETMLNKSGYGVRPVPNGDFALRAARASNPDLILLDINMPGMNGYEVCEQLKADNDLKNIPVIFISALDETIDKVKAFHVGGVDYITKPFHFAEVLARIETQLKIYWQRQEIERLREGDRLYYQKISELKDRVMNMASHDLKNPLGNIRNSTHMLRQHGRVDDEFGEKYLSLIERNAERAIDLVRGLLDLAHIETGMSLQKSKFVVDTFLDQIVEDFALAAEEKNISLRYSPASPDIVLYADENRLGQAVHNLLSNAIKYTPNKGAVELSLSDVDETAIISIQDTGLGIPAEDIPFVFEKFHRVNSPAHRDIEGTGLGLSIVESIVEQHHGKVEVESELNRGSVFRILLPYQV